MRLIFMVSGRAVGRLCFSITQAIARQRVMLKHNLPTLRPLSTADSSLAAVCRSIERGGPTLPERRWSWGSNPRAESLPPGLLAEADTAGSNPQSPIPDLLKRAAAYGRFCREVIDVVAPLVPAVKPQAAFFEELGPAGTAVLAE